MLHITLGPWKKADPEDGLGRSHVGYRPDMSEQEMYRCNHGEWPVGKKRQDTERFALFSFEGMVVQAIEVDRYQRTREFTREEKRDDKYTLHGVNGQSLKAGHPVYDKYVGRPTPSKVTPGRNPIRYFSDPEFDGTAGRPCRCGCGETTMAGDFVPGHDQKAIHERIARVGTVADFLDWMDDVRPPQPAR